MIEYDNIVIVVCERAVMAIRVWRQEAQSITAIYFDLQNSNSNNCLGYIDFLFS